MNLQQLNQNCLIIILNYLGSFTEFKNIKIINKNLNKELKEIWKYNNGYANTIFPKRTMISFNICIVCKKFNKNNIQLHSKHYDYPTPIYVTCNNWKCIHNCILDLFIDSYKKNIFYLHRDNNFPKKSLIPRSNNEKTIANIENRFVLIKDNNIYIKTNWIDKKGNLYQKYVNNKVLKYKIKFSTWYKDFKNGEINFNFNEILKYEN